MPVSFNEQLAIGEDGCISLAAGPLEIEEGETVERLDIWVWQNRGACMASKLGPFGGKQWEMKPVHHENHSGKGFQPGPATAMGLMVTRTADETRTFQWVVGITLIAERDIGAAKVAS
jgi:hypothetical protein